MLHHHLNPAFIKGQKGELFVFQVQPLGEPKGHVIYLPAHGEELNRCRTLAASHAKAFAKEGLECTIVDYYGTGDSDGNFSEGNFAVWLDDLSNLVSTIKGQGTLPIYLAGFRLGALLALTYINSNPKEIAATLLIQPVTQGKQYVTQLLRQRLAGQLSGGSQTETTEQMRQSLRQGNNIEIGGYDFGAALLIELDDLALSSFNHLKDQNFVWLEFLQGSTEEVTIGSQRAISLLEQAGNRVEKVCISDPPIWQLHERALTHNNIDAVQKVAKKW